MNRITLFERQVIESGLRVGKSVRAISKSLGRDHRVIQREVNRNQMDMRPYCASLAEKLALEREKKRHKRKLDKFNHLPLKQYVVDCLKKDWSPEQISGVLKRQCPSELAGSNISPETIYQYIYEGSGRYDLLFKHLRRGRKRRQRRWSRKISKTAIPERISIHLRPAEVFSKTTLGHWESDTVEGKKPTRANLSVQYERKTMLARIHRVENKTAGETENALRKTFDSLPLYCFKTITFDNGGEGATHGNLINDFNISTYFCDPFCSWQKGGVENLNSLIRQYLPKGSDFTYLTDKQIYDIQERLNNRPRKQLNYLTPNQVLAQEVGH